MKENARMTDNTSPAADAAVPTPGPDAGPASGAAAAVTLPDHLSVDPRSPFYMDALMDKEIGITFNGKRRFDVQEYCLSEGWIKVPAGKTVDRKGQPLLIKLKGKVDAFLV